MLSDILNCSIPVSQFKASELLFLPCHPSAAFREKLGNKRSPPSSIIKKTKTFLVGYPILSSAPKKKILPPFTTELAFQKQVKKKFWI